MNLLILLLPAMLFLAYSNGANDNIKGIATLYGSKTLSYRKSLAIATVATLLGALTAAYIGEELAKAFSGKGLVADEIVSSPQFLVAVAMGAAITVSIATKIGIPISTTHAITGALTGGGLAAVGLDINIAALGKSFFIPLAVSPLIALALTSLIYKVFAKFRKDNQITEDSELRLAKQPSAAANFSFSTLDKNLAPATPSDSTVALDKPLSIPLKKPLDALHILSGSLVCFARGLNDAPKIVGIAMLASAYNLRWLTFAAAASMTIGGLIHSKAVLKKMANDITPLNSGQGFTANLVTSILVLFASKLGIPVSTTHVSCGSIIGIGTANRSGNGSVIRQILAAWFLTLPIAAIFSALGYFLLGLF